MYCTCTVWLKVPLLLHFHLILHTESLVKISIT
jgi:hypothetical protein